VANDYTIRYDKKIYQIARAEIRPGLRGATVRVEERFDQSVWVRFRDRYLRVRVCESQPQTPAPAPVPKLRSSSPAKPNSTWIKGFSLRNSPPLWKIMQQEQGKRRGRRERSGRFVVGANLSRPTGSLG